MSAPLRKPKQSAEAQLCADIAGFAHDPLGYVLYAFPWGVKGTSLERHKGPRKWQREYLQDLGFKLKQTAGRGKFEVVQEAVASGHGVGKALSIHQALPTPTGIRRMGDLKPGDLVYAGNGKPTRVVGVALWGKRPACRVRFDDDSEVIADVEHEWAVRGRNERRTGSDRWRIMTTQQIMDAGVTRPNGTTRARQWEIPAQGTVAGSIETRWGYAIGVWLGDGHAGRGCYSKPYCEVSDHLAECGMVVRNGTDGTMHYVHGLYTELRRFGLYELRSYERFIPDECFDWIEADRAELLRGLLDTDGECTEQGSIIYSSTSHALAQDVVRLARSLGGKAQMQPTVKEAYIGEVRHRDCWRVTIAVPDGFSPFYVRHKAERVKSIEPRYLKRWIDSITPIEPTETMCIEVADPSHLFLAGDYVVTHNSALTAWLVLWAMSTFENTRGVVTANTETQLRTKTWPELAKWHGLAVNRHWFTCTATALFHADDKFSRNWRTDCVTWSETNTEAFAGLHNQGQRIILLFDEASSIPPKVWEVAEGALTDENTEIIWAVFGNPTRPIGRFKDCFGRFRQFWRVRNIDSRTVEGTNTELLNSYVERYGLESDFVKVRVLGQFPGNDPRQLIAFQWIDDALDRPFDLVLGDGSIPTRRITVDVADGGEDFTVVTLAKRWQSMDVIIEQRQFNFPSAVSPIMAADAAEELWKESGCSAKAGDLLVVDSLGVGAGTTGELMRRGYPVVRYIGGAASSDTARWRNRRTQSYMVLRDKFRDGRIKICREAFKEFADLDDLTEQLASLRTMPTDRLEDLETKERMKERGVKSPDRADSLAMAYATDAPDVVTHGPVGTQILPQFIINQVDHFAGMVR